MIIQQFTGNQERIRRLKASIDSLYPKGRFVAIEGDDIVANAATFREVDALLNAAGKISKQIVVVQAGVNYPDHTFMFL